MNALDLLYIPVVAATAPWWARKRRSGWGERLGRIAPVADRDRGPRVLLHAVSVGEVNALRELVPILAGRAHVIVSVGTDTGMARARELFAKPGSSGSPPADVVRYPLDFSWAVERFLRAVRPDVVGLVELEVWPNFVSACAGRGVPIAVINGRLSERSFKGYRRARWFFRRSFGRLAAAGVQDETYRARFLDMGVEPVRCTVTGSMKWDSARIESDVAGAMELAREMGIDRSRPLVVAGSTAEDEEALLHGVVSELEAQRGPVQLLCAPRKPEHFDEAAAALPGCVRRTRTRGGGTGDDGGPPARRFLLDTIGELRKAYALADVVVMGRSFGSLYGSDPIEPVGLGKATVIGPAISDFVQAVEALERGGGIVRTDRAGLKATLGALLDDHARRDALAARGQAVIRAQQGASARHAELLLGLAARQRR